MFPLSVVVVVVVVVVCVCVFIYLFIYFNSFVGWKPWQDFSKF
jgi:hypothetical protein